MFKKYVFLATFLMVLVAVLLLIIQSNPSFKNVVLGSIASVESNAVNKQTINELVVALRTNDAVATKKLFEKNPDFLQSITALVNVISPVDETTNDEDIIHKSELLELVFELRLSRKLIQQSIASKSTTVFQDLINNDITKPFNAWLKHSSEVENLSNPQERLLSVVVKLKASDFSSNTYFNTQYFVSRYKQEKDKYSKHSLFYKGLLHASWLKQFVSQKVDTESNLGEKFDLVSSDLNTDTDLIRLLNHKNDAVVITTAELIGFYLPKNAINALRFQLIRSKDTTVKIALLDALSVYGTQARSATKQLKSLLNVTKSDVIHKKINETISKLNGKFQDPQNNKA